MSQSMYFAGWEARFNGDRQCEAFVLTQSVAKEVAESISDAIELVFEGENLARAHNIELGERRPRPLEASEMGFRFQEIPTHEPFQISFAADGYHHFGGPTPVDFIMPSGGSAASFQYLGRISRNDPNFAWLPNDLDLVCPVYLNFDKLYLDYARHNIPEVVNTLEIDESECEFDEVSRNSEIIYVHQSFGFVRSIESSRYGQAGFPTWIQFPDIPRCPVSGNVMRFVCQLNGGIPVAHSNVVCDEERRQQYFDEMNFWGDGELYVFFEPTSKIACYLIQNT